ncbi:gliding motility-associated-like protein [Winogradskyella wandonensis]|uniref:Gliding motility-associated-like protein n=1 Tax=Winogradskyella wandonensis TaxID=1442586 RepID=A0A4R1KSL1_9FLAO|nr:gliding motility-associated C-terminal domain-containing protein [Winogradskyella wandonensis]TCK67583.1 gliding motility-associated-like protein [Winogradskyella wandonensis]
MKTNLINRNLFKSITAALLLFAFTSHVSAQCPTVTNPSPLVCDAAGLTIQDLNIYATDINNDIQWYDSPTGGTTFNSNELVSEGVYYAGNSTGTCGTREAITVSFVLSPTNQNLDAVYCSNESPTIQLYIDEVLSFAQPPGGSVEIYTDFELANQALPTDAIPTGGTNYFIVFVDSSGCRSQIEVGTTATFDAPDEPTPPSVQSFCTTANPTVADLIPGTVDVFNWYESLDGAGNPIQPALMDTDVIVSGTYYIQAESFFCTSNPIVVTVEVNTPIDPGTSATLEYCIDSLPTTDINLVDQLGGTPDALGTWSGPITITNGTTGTINIGSVTTPGDLVFTYTVPASGPCPEGSSTVTITIYDSFTSGTPAANNPASFCVSGLPGAFDLFTLLDNEDVGGQWTEGTLSTGVATTSTIDFSGFAPGTYDYTYTQNLAPNVCAEESTTVQVIILEDPNAGVALNASICENEIASNSPFDLFSALDGSQDNNSGTWTDANGVVVTSPVDISTFTVSGSPFQFTYTISNGTCEDAETISITIEPAPESGNALTPLELCFEELTANSPLDLFTLLDGTQDTNGTWYEGTDASGTAVSNPVDISAFADGTYNYTYSVPNIGTCSDVDVTVQLIVLPQPNTGTPTNATFCENDVAGNSPLDLFGQLTGNDAGGTWSDDDASGALSGSNVDLTSLPIGSYNFTYSITSTQGCTNSSTVTVTLEDAPESGTVNPPAEFCIADVSSGETFNLFDLLEGEDQSGVWSDDDASGALAGNTVTLDGLATGTYDFTFDVNAIGTCDDSLVTVTLIILDTATPTATTVQEFCDSGLVGDLAATGNSIQWYDEATGGNPLDASTPLVNGETYYATQTDASTGCESSVRFEVTVNIFTTPISGNAIIPGLIECNDNASIDLFTGLDGTQDAGGVWQDDSATGAVTDNSLDATGLTPGDYQFTYFIAATPPCIDASTTITITIEEALNPGTDASTNVCIDAGTIDLFPLLGGADLGGTWSPALTSGTGVFDPLVDAAGPYTYELVNACGSFISVVTVSVTLPANAGEDNTAEVCVIDGTFDLTTLLNGTPDSTGTWFPELTSGTNIFDPTADTSGVYTYTVAATAPCTTDASAQVTITVNDIQEPTVIEATPAFCVIDNPTVADLSSAVTVTGSLNWYADAALTTALSDSEALIDGEDYFATQTAANGCESSNNISVVVTINDTPTPTLLDASLDYCINDNPTIGDLSQNISENGQTPFTVVWYDAINGGSTYSNSDDLESEQTYYAALINTTTGCESSVRLEVMPDLTNCGALVIPDGFSPNGDGVNDTFDVDNLEVLHPNFEMEIYNRYGNLVYKGNAASPRFDGTSNQSTIGDKVLPVGVYFYIFNFNDGENKPVQGRLYLSR